MMSNSAPHAEHKNDPQVEVARITSRQVVLVTIITVIGGIVGAILQAAITKKPEPQIVTSTPDRATIDKAAKCDTLVIEVTALKAQLEAKDRLLADAKRLDATEKVALYELTADRIEAEFTNTSGKNSVANDAGLDVAEIDFRRLRRAVFMSIYALHADQQVADVSLDHLAKRGYEWVTKSKPRLLAEFSDIRTWRLRWLEDMAAPAMRRAIDELRQSPNQMAASATVELPKELQIIPHSQGGVPTAIVTSLDDIEKEIRLIKASLSSGG